MRYASPTVGRSQKSPPLARPVELPRSTLRVVAIVQARMGSTRLPGKNGMMICGKPAIWHVLRRVQQAQNVDQVVLAIPREPVNNDVLIEAAADLEIFTYQDAGDPNDLLTRHYQPASRFHADVIVRVPGDNPCVDPEQIDKAVEYFFSLRQPVGKWLVSTLDQNVLNNGYPGGLGAEVYSSWFLHWLWRNLGDPFLREHPHMWAHRTRRVRTLAAPPWLNRPALHFDINTQADFDYITGIYEALYPTKPDFTSKDLIAYLESTG